MSIYLQNPVYERVITETLFLLKIPTAEALRRVPKPFRVLEIGPGLALLGIGLQKIAGTSFCPSKDIDKIYVTYGIHARYDVGTASPRFAFYVHRVYASDSVFMDYIEKINHSLVYRGKRLTLVYDPEAISFRAEDADGLILTLRSTHASPVFRNYTVWNQAAVTRDGVPYLQATEWKGEAFEHQSSPEAGEIFEHPLFGDQPVLGLGRQAYHQLVMRPHSEATMALFQPVRRIRSDDHGEGHDMDYDKLELHKDYSIWNYDYSIGFALEIDSEKVRRFLPKGLYPFEVKPGVSLLMFNTIQFMEGNHNFAPAFSEVTISVNVIPDLYLAGRLPKFAVYVINIGVDDLAFASDPYNTDKLPFYPTRLEIRVDREKRAVSCRDELGLICELQDISAERRFERKEDFFQAFASHEGRILHGAMTLDAESYEHQRSGACGKVFAHPIFRGLDAAMTAAENYMQLFTAREALGIQHYYRLRPVQA